MTLSNEATLRVVANFLAEIPNSGVTSMAKARTLSQVVDEQYTVVARARIKETLASNPLLVPILAKPGDELADCDDYALQLKAALTARARQDNLMSGTYEPPPAIGMLFSINHAVNVFVTFGAKGEPRAMIVDASLPNQPMTGDPVKARTLLKELPLTLFYI